MTHTLCLEGKLVADELYDLLQQVAHTSRSEARAELERAAQRHLRGIEKQIRQVLDDHPQLDLDRSLKAIHQRLHEIARVIEEHAPEWHPGTISGSDQWQRFRRRAFPAYEALAASLKPYTIHVPSLRPTNYLRNLWHVSSGLTTVLLIQHLLTPMWMILIALVFAVFAWSMEVARRLSPGWNRILMAFFSPVAHPHEHFRVNSSTWFCTALLVLALFGTPLICSLALTVLAVSDPVAALIGRRFGRTRLRAGRSLEGTIAFVISGALAGLVVLTVYYPWLGWRAVLLAMSAALAGAAAELFSVRVDDNLSIPVAAAAALTVVSIVMNIGA